jgi:Dolichyl-phosphate-mannose-protein mannosyltransferase
MRQPPWVGHPAPVIGSALIAVTFLAGCFCHYFRIAHLPMGFYVDESSIGYNAYLISQTGADEHGVRWPLFFIAFGEYKNPLYVYLLSGLYRLLGYSEWTTRALSASCWLAGSLCLYELARRLFIDNTTRLYVALCLAFTPWVFTLSRVSFELIALYPLLALHLLALYRGFEDNSPRWALISGIAISLCIYAYTTFRLLAPLHCFTVLAFYSASRFRKAQALFVLGAVICAIPFALYAAIHFHNLTGRFNTITFLHDPTLSVLEKVETFFGHYIGYFSPRFLALSGDANRRHHTGFGGELLPTTVLLLLIALVTIRRDRINLFRLYLVAGLVLSPVAAALTSDTGHSLRAFSMLAFALVISAYGLATLGPLAARVVVALTSISAILYVIHYFVIYPPESAVAFENFGFKDALQEALDQAPTRVVLSDDGDEAYINLCFFGSLARTRVPLLTGSRKDVRPGDVYISYDPDRGLKGLYSVDRIASRPLFKPRMPGAGSLMQHRGEQSVRLTLRSSGDTLTHLSQVRWRAQRDFEWIIQ